MIQYRMNRINITMTIMMAAIFAYEDFKFKYLASFLYFCESEDRLLALESNTGKNIK